MRVINSIILTKDNVKEVIDFVDEYDSRFGRFYTFENDVLCIRPYHWMEGNNFYCKTGDKILAWHTEEGRFMDGTKTKITLYDKSLD